MVCGHMIATWTKCVAVVGVASPLCHRCGAVDRLTPAGPTIRGGSPFSRPGRQSAAWPWEIMSSLSTAQVASSFVARLEGALRVGTVQQCCLAPRAAALYNARCVPASFETFVFTNIETNDPRW